MEIWGFVVINKSSIVLNHITYCLACLIGGEKG